MRKKTIGLLLAALLVLTSLWLPAPLGGIREAEAETNIMLKSAFYNQETNSGCVLACCAMAFENVRHETIAYKKDGNRYSGFQAVYQANGAKDSAQWGTLYKIFEITETTFIKTAQYGSRSAAEVEELFLKKLKSNPNGILAFFRKSKTDGTGHCILIVGYKNGTFYVNDPARNLKNGKEIPITDSYVAKNLLKTSSQKTILEHIGFAEVYVDANPSKKLTITFNPNGGTVKDEEKTKTVTKNKTYGTLPVPTRDGYSFLGWFETRSGGNEITSSTKVVRSSNHSIFAHWEADPDVTVTFDPQEGTCSTASKTVTPGSAYGTLPVPTRQGYTFAGWWTAKDSGGKKVTASTVCYASGNYTLYARWTEGYTMTFNPNGGTVSPTTKVVKYGQQYGSLPVPTRAGYTFAGWWTTKAEGGKQVTSSTVCYASSGYTLYARWTPRKFVITLDPNGGECATKTKTVTYGQAYGTMPVPSPRTGYTFSGWYTAKTGGKKVTTSTICYATANYTLYARWTPKTYTVTLNPNGGSCTVSSKTATYGQQYGTLPVPTRDGYVFAGWYTTQTTGGKQVFSSTTCYATGNYTLYARWWKN